LNLNYAYGIGKSFGMDFDPVLGNMCDSENGPDFADEINLVRPVLKLVEECRGNLGA
jgi:hypothetical protein